MSLLHRTDHQSANEKARKHSGYGFVLALIRVALAFVAAKYAKYSRHSADVGGLTMTTKEIGHRSGWPKFEENDRQRKEARGRMPASPLEVKTMNASHHQWNAEGVKSLLSISNHRQQSRQPNVEKLTALPRRPQRCLLCQARDHRRGLVEPAAKVVGPLSSPASATREVYARAPQLSAVLFVTAAKEFGTRRSGLPQKLRQLGDIRRDPSRFIFGEKLGR